MSIVFITTSVLTGDFNLALYVHFKKQICM